MSLIRFTCECGITIRKLFRAGKEITGSLPCECGKEMKRILSGPAGIGSRISVDNGVQARAVEINVDHIKDGENRARFAQNLREAPTKSDKKK